MCLFFHHLLGRSQNVVKQIVYWTVHFLEIGFVKWIVDKGDNPWPNFENKKDKFFSQFMQKKVLCLSRDYPMGTAWDDCRIDILVANIIFLRGTCICGPIILFDFMIVHGCCGSSFCTWRMVGGNFLVPSTPHSSSATWFSTSYSIPYLGSMWNHHIVVCFIPP